MKALTAIEDVVSKEHRTIHNEKRVCEIHLILL